MSLRWPINSQAELIDDFDLLSGIRFAMFDGDNRMVCRVSYQALLERAKIDGVPEETTRQTFMRHRNRIIELAIAKYEAGEVSPVIIAIDLTPGISN
jgi:hypothetical protein